MKELVRILKISIVITICIQLYELLFVIKSLEGWYVELQQVYFDFAASLLITAANIYFINYADKKYSWNTQPKKRLVVGITGSLILTMACIAFIRFAILVGIYDKDIYLFFKEEKLNFYLSGFVITTITTSIFYAFYFYKELQKQKIVEQKVIAGTASAKFTALKNQLDPHFLFNSLNVLVSLIEENPELAQKFTTSLSKVYRYVLEQKDKELVTIEEELKFAKTYMTLLKLRFEDSIIFKMPNKVNNPEAKIIPLSLQILLENTVKHNVVTAQRPLEIEIYEKDNFLMVTNNLQPKDVMGKSSGVGLSNVKQRYALVTKRPFSIHKTKDAFTAELPLLTQQIKGNPGILEIKNKQELMDLKYKRAKERVKKIKGFYANLTAYTLVIPFLVFINYKNNQLEFAWVLFPAFGWGLGLLFDAMTAFNWHPLLGKDWESRKINNYIKAQNKKL